LNLTSYNSIVVSGIVLGISIRFLSLQSTTPLKHIHGYGHTNIWHVYSISSVSIQKKVHLLFIVKGPQEIKGIPI